MEAMIRSVFISEAELLECSGEFETSTTVRDRPSILDDRIGFRCSDTLLVTFRSEVRGLGASQQRRARAT